MKKDNHIDEEPSAFDKMMLDILMTMVNEDVARSQQLKDATDGFHLTDRKYPCCICGSQVMNENSWYDRDGIKCMICKSSMDRNEISIELKNHDLWYSASELKHYFNLTASVIKRWIKAGYIVPTYITRNDSKVHLEIFTLEENKHFLPPKSLLKGGWAKKEGESDYGFYSWYNFVNVEEHLKAYQIVHFLKTVPVP